jgi:hypothetical protein
MSGEVEPLRCLHCDQTKSEIKREQTICGIVSGYEYQELTDEWPNHRWADWKDHELPKFILPEFRDLYRRTQATQFEWLPCEHTTIGHKYPADSESIEYYGGSDQCMFCGTKQEEKA